MSTATQSKRLVSAKVRSGETHLLLNGLKSESQREDLSEDRHFSQKGRERGDRFWSHLDRYPGMSHPSVTSFSIHYLAFKTTPTHHGTRLRCGVQTPQTWLAQSHMPGVRRDSPAIGGISIARSLVHRGRQRKRQRFLFPTKLAFFLLE